MAFHFLYLGAFVHNLSVFSSLPNQKIVTALLRQHYRTKEPDPARLCFG